MGIPSISVRKYIRLGDQEAEEPTSTIVVTSQTSHFVDIRIFKDALDLPVTNSSKGDLKPILEWGFAGTSHHEAKYDQSKMVKYSHSVWEHWIDSRTDEPPIDEGDTWPQPDGDVLELGTQVDPVTGVKRKYEELWGDVPVQAFEGDNEERVSLVLKVDDREHNARGLVVRVGQYCQGILQVGDQLLLERWEWNNLADEAEPGHQGSWRCKVRMGDGSLPCNQVLNVKGYLHGAIIRSAGLEWRVIEDYRW